MHPAYSLHSSDKTSPRGFRWVWFFRPAQALISLIILGLAGVNIAGLAATKGVTCSIPGKMGWNLACAVLSLIALAYLTLSSGTLRIFKILPWWIFIQLGLDALMFIFWLSAAATSHFTCEDLCTTCDAWGYSIYYDRLSCSCNSVSSYYDYFWKREMSPNPNPGLSAGLEKRKSKSSSSSSRKARMSGVLVAREALDAIMVVLFFITLCATAWWMWQNRPRKTGDAAAAISPENGATAVPMDEKKVPQASVSPVSDGTQYQPPPQQQAYPPQEPPQSYQPPYYQQGGYPQQQSYLQQQQGYPQQSYSEAQQAPTTPYAGMEGQQHRDVTPQQHGIPDYPTPTPTPEMQGQAEHRAAQ